MAGLDRLFVGGDREPGRQAVLGLGGGLAEQVEQARGIGHLEVPAAHLALVFEEHLTIGHAGAVELQIEDIVDALDVHRQPFEPVGEFARDRATIEAADLLEIGELGHLHPVAPHFPAEPPRTERRAFPIILDEPDIVACGVDPDCVEASEIQRLEVGRARLQHHLILVIMA